MIVSTLELTLYAPWVHSLKEKRMLVKSLVEKVRNRFNVSACELGQQDVHQTIVIGIACISNEKRLNESVLEKVVHFAEGSTEAEITGIFREER